MPNSCSKIEATRDNKHIFILGSYPYQIKCYEYLNMSEKFLRGIDMHCDKFKLISADDSKFCALKSDRNLEFHTGRGIHHNIIVPDLVTDLNLDLQSASMYMISNTKIFSLNLEFGKFQRTIEQSEFSYTVGDFNEYHSLYSAGKLDGSVAFYDPRTPNQIGEVKCASNSSRDFEVSSIKFRNETMLGVGLSSGEINLFDIRSKTPILIKDHYFRFPISKLQYSDNEYQRDIILSADQKAIKIW
ncbi:MAG: Nucleolar protein 10, partial [Marteilia pararefringens]